MKKTILLLQLLCAMPALGPWAGGRQTSGDMTNAGIAFLLPKVTLDFSDLDVRDDQNHIIKSPSAIQELTTLFRENLLNLVVFASPHAAAQSLIWIESLSYLINKSILIRLSVTFELILDVFLPTTRRFVHNVDILCISFAVGTLLAALTFCSNPLQRTPRKVNLRC